jgi:hypothetical protein
MHRRFLLSAVLALALAPTAHTALAQAADTDSDSAPAGSPHVSISLQQMRAALDQRFPLRYPVPGMLNLDVQTPRLRLLPEQNRLGAELDLLASGPALERRHQGTLELDFALRYETSDRTVRAHQLRLRRLQFPTLQPGVEALLNGYAPSLAERSLQEVVLHQLQPKDLALADTLGLQPGSIRVTEAGLEIALVTKPL